MLVLIISILTILVLFVAFVIRNIIVHEKKVQEAKKNGTYVPLEILD